jgi:hypothetical protein
MGSKWLPGLSLEIVVATIGGNIQCCELFRSMIDLRTREWLAGLAAFFPKSSFWT